MGDTEVQGNTGSADHVAQNEPLSSPQVLFPPIKRVRPCCLALPGMCACQAVWNSCWFSRIMFVRGFFLLNPNPVHIPARRGWVMPNSGSRVGWPMSRVNMSLLLKSPNATSRRGELTAILSCRSWAIFGSDSHKRWKEKQQLGPTWG